MTTEQHMQPKFALQPMIAVIPVIAAFLTGCTAPTTDLRLPAPLVAPYDARSGDVLWAIAPLRNETGVSVVDGAGIADTLAATFQEARGISTVPVNRTLAAMRALGMDEIASGADARRLALAMGVDGVIAGTVTAWDPYDPPRLGMSLALYSRPGGARLVDDDAVVDPRSLTSSPTERRLPPAGAGDAPLSTVAEHLDGANHEVLAALRAYAEGRHDPNSALGWRGYLASMSLFTKFASHRLAGNLLDKERLRLARMVAMQESPAAPRR